MQRSSRFEWLAVLMGGIATAALLVLGHHALASIERVWTWYRLATAVEIGMADAHVAIEEYTAGDRSIRVDDVLGPLEDARSACTILRDGGRVHALTVPALPSTAGSPLPQLCDDLDRLATFARVRLTERVSAGPGTSIDASFDAVFATADRSAEELYERIDGLVASTLRRVRVALGGLAGLFLMLAVIATVLLRRARHRLEQLGQRYASVLDSTSDAIFALDDSGRVTLANPAAERLTGYEAGELHGRLLHELVHARHPDGTPRAFSDCPTRHVIADGTDRTVDDDVIWHKDGRSIPVDYSVTPLLRGEVVTGVVQIVRDISERRAAERALADSARRLADAEQLAGMGSCEWDLAVDRVLWSAGMSHLMDLEHRAEHTVADWLETVHPDEREHAMATLHHALENGGGDYALDYRGLLPDGALRDFESRAIIERDADGQAVRMLGTVQDVTERRAIERMKDEFVSVVSHELRTPLTALHGALGLLAGGAIGKVSDRGRHMLEIAVGNTERLIRLVNDILDVERLTSGRLTIDPATCDAVALVEETVAVMAPMAAEAGITLAIDADTCRPPVHADRGRVAQVLTNLISNAVKFSPPGATVTITVRSCGSETLCEVRDEGRGIPADQLESVFGRFQQVDTSDSREKGGTGLGLAICKAIVEQHGGRIWACSQAGQGSVLSFVLPSGGTRSRTPRADRSAHDLRRGRSHTAAAGSPGCSPQRNG